MTTTTWRLAAIALTTVVFGAPAVAQSPVRSSPAAETSADMMLRTLLDEVWEFELTESPLLATDAGDPPRARSVSR